jgi:hypothetical protein
MAGRGPPLDRPFRRTPVALDGAYGPAGGVVAGASARRWRSRARTFLGVPRAAPKPLAPLATARPEPTEIPAPCPTGWGCFAAAGGEVTVSEGTVGVARQGLRPPHRGPLEVLKLVGFPQGVLESEPEYPV